MYKMNIEHISISRAGTWDECKQRYKFRYHLKVPAPGEEPFYFIYGKIVHKIAEEYVKYGGDKTLNEISTAVLNGEIKIDGKEAPSLPPDYKKRFPSHLRAIDSLTNQIGFGGELELPFNLDLDPPHGKLIAGVIDRLIIKEKVFIIDYKTTKRGKWRKTPDTIRKDLQLRAYAWAVNQLYNIDYDKIRGALYYVEGGNLIPVKFTENSVQAAIKELISVYDEIKSCDPNTVIGTTGDHCARCDYRTICPFYQLKGRR
jgi:CRISPR/Cas system-associated exonuclease Cas4 (RecB family)